MDAHLTSRLASDSPGHRSEAVLPGCWRHLWVNRNGWLHWGPVTSGHSSHNEVMLTELACATYRDVNGIIYGCSNIPPARSVVLFGRTRRAVPRPLAQPATGRPSPARRRRTLRR